jgi:cytochrome b subunit of formate dehydrogenase
MALAQQKLNLQALLREQFQVAKYWWNIAAVTQLIVVIVGILATFANLFSATATLVVPILTIASVLARWRSDRLKGNAESILRKMEFASGLGWGITGRETSDLLLTLPAKVKRQASKNADPSVNYFDSSESVSARRLLENLEESTWWTKHQAQRMSFYTTILAVVVMFVAVAALIISVQATLNQATLTNISKVVAAVIAFAFSGGYVRLAFDYHKYAREAARAEDQACTLQKEQHVIDAQAIKLLHEYQIARAGAPMLPDWLWGVMQRELNDLWAQHRRRDAGGTS